MAVSGKPFPVFCMLHMMDQDGIVPGPKLLRKLEKFHGRAKKQVLAAEESGSFKIPYHVKLDKANNYAKYRQFSAFYKEWLARTEMEAPVHPWKQFLTQKDIDMKDRDDIIQKVLEYQDDEEKQEKPLG